MAIFSFFYTF